MDSIVVSRILNSLNLRRKQLAENEKGFTLIELLVVVVIIGILAAIAIPVYLGIQGNAKDSSIQSDATNAKTAVIAYYTDKGEYPTTTGATLKSDLKPYGLVTGEYTGDITFTRATSPATGFCIQANSIAGGTGTTFATTDMEGAKKGTCSAAGAFVGPTP